jgi:4-amino-4-deoxy-L-arabinose transferase-like glycosyltransferase
VPPPDRGALGVAETLRSLAVEVARTAAASDLESGGSAPARDSAAARRYQRLTWALVAALFLGRLWLCRRFELAGDEAYFWLWSRRLAWGYFSKGPGIAALIRLGTALGGTSELGVRLAAVVASAGASLGIFALGRALYSARVGFWTVVVANTTPLFCAGSLLATADMPSICLWTWSAVLLWRLRAGGGLARWAGLGALVGLGTLVRFVVAAEPVCFALYLAAAPAGRRRLREPGFWLMLAVAAACLLPWIGWERAHGWITWDHLRARGALDRPWGLHPRALGEFLALQVAVVLPYSAGAVVAWCGGAARRLDADAWRFLTALSLPLFGFYTLLAFNAPGQPNWTGPAFVAAGLLMVAVFLDFAERRPAVRRLNLAAVAAGVGGAVAVHLALAAFWLPAGHDPLVRLRGGSDLAAQVTVAARRTGAAFVIGSHYQVASLVAFYQTGQPAALPVFTPCGPRPANQLDLWGGYGEEWAGRDGLFVEAEGGVPADLARQFAAIEALPAVEARWHGRAVHRYGLFLCHRLLRGCA